MDHDSVEASLVAHTQLERLTGDNQYFCESCQCKVDAVKVTRFEELPPILTLSLSRFYFDAKHMQSVKLEKMCSFPLILDMSNFFVNKTNKKVRYNLFSVVLHVGGSTGGGHYHAFIKDPYGTVRETSKDSASNNKWREPAMPGAVETNDSTMDSHDFGPCKKNNESYDDDIPFADGEQTVETPLNYHRLSPKSKRPNVSDYLLDYTSINHTLQTPPWWNSCKGGREFRARSRFSDAYNWKPPPSGFNRLNSPPLFSDSERAGDHAARHNQTSKSTNFLGSADRTSGSVSKSSVRKTVSSSASSISEIVGRIKNSLSIDSSGEPVEPTQKNPSQRGLIQNVAKKESNPKPKQASLPHTKRLVPIVTAHSIEAVKHAQTINRPVDAISVYPIKPVSPLRNGEYRSRSAHSIEYGQHKKEVSKFVRKKLKESTQFPKPSPLTHQRQPSSYRNEPNVCKTTTHRKRQCCVPSCGFTPIQSSQHNSGPRGTTPSKISPSQSPNGRQAHEPRTIPPLNEHIASRPIWHSRLFDGSNTDEHANLQKSTTNSIHPASHSGDPLRDLSAHMSRELIYTNRTLFSDGSSHIYVEPTRPPPLTNHAATELEDSLDSIPAMQRTNAQYPTRTSLSHDTEIGPSRMTSHTLTCGKSADYDSFCDRNSFNQTESITHLNTEEEQEEECERVLEKDEEEEDSEHDVRIEQLPKTEHTENQTMTYGQHSRSSSRIRDFQPIEDNHEVVVGRWFDFNDDCIVEVDPSTFSRVFEGPECAYMLFYRRTNLPDPVVSQSK